MQHLIAYTVAAMASLLGWRLGSLGGPVLGYFLSIVAAAAGLYLARRGLRQLLG
jgi:hypothetical protein